MHVKSYRAQSMQEALELVRRDLGPDASVLQSREVETSWWEKLWGAKTIEVTASTKVRAPARFLHAPQDSMASAEKTPSQSTSRPRWPMSLVRLYSDLIDAETPQSLARQLVDRVRSISPSEVDERANNLAETRLRLAMLLERQFPAAREIRLTPSRRRVVALVGPTGVGKTTTIAKLAANFHLRDQRRVGLITIDTFRIAAAEQLGAYAQIINLPMETAGDPDQLQAALRRMEKLDLVLIDTAGQGIHDNDRLNELQTMLQHARADETHLVLSTAASGPRLIKTLRRFSSLGVDSLLLTKLDEAAGLGGLLPLLLSARRPISYVTTGQNVPDDIEPANSRKLSQAIAGVSQSMSPSMASPATAT